MHAYTYINNKHALLQQTAEALYFFLRESL